MIKINLLPYHEKAKKENISRQIFIIAGSFIFFILLLIYVQILEKFKTNKKELEQKLAVIHTLEENRLAPVKTLDDLAALVPSKNIWLTKITQKGNNFKIEGVGRDNIAVADFMKTIEKFEPIKSVDLVSSKKTEISGITLQLFIFSCVIKKGF